MGLKNHISIGDTLYELTDSNSVKEWTVDEIIENIFSKRYRLVNGSSFYVCTSSSFKKNLFTSYEQCLKARRKRKR
jgi:hypothetical protein